MAGDTKTPHVELGEFATSGSDTPPGCSTALESLEGPGVDHVNASSSDDKDMWRMGKKQSFQRNFEFLSIAAFSVVAICGWCYVPSTSTAVLANGGTGGLILMFLVNWLGLGLVVLSLAEMSSIAPTAGGQYHWISEFAPPRLQRILSYISGWLSSIAWQAGTAGGMYLSGSTLRGLVVVNNPDYDPKAWHAYLFVVLVATFCLAVNTLAAGILPRLEGPAFVLGGMTFVATLVVLWTRSPELLTANEVFTTFTKGAGWSSLGPSLLVSQGPILFLITGSDSTAHLAEETRNAAVAVPRAMITSYVINGSLTFIMTIFFCFILVDYSAAENSAVGQLGFPFIQVFVNAIGSVTGATVLIAIIVFLGVVGLTNWMASNARQIFAFARDQGFPFSRWIARVNAAGTYPLNSVICVFMASVLLNLITLGSVVAFEAIVSLQILALMSTYMVSLGCIVWRRLYGEPLPKSPWTLGKFALPINLAGIAYCIYLIVFLPWPGTVPVTLSTMNWSSAMFGGIMIISAVYYLVWARKLYKGPVVYVRPRED